MMLITATWMSRCHGSGIAPRHPAVGTLIDIVPPATTIAVDKISSSSDVQFSIKTDLCAK
jgi:hypothetical protein